MTDQNLLIIDSNPQQLSATEVQLRSSGYEVMTASTMERALKLLSVSKPDLIIACYQLNGDQTAVDLCRRLRGEIATRELPFVVLVDDADQRVEAITAGADEVLTQPVYLAELRDRVGLLLQRRKRLGLEQGVGQKFFGRLEEMGLLDLLQVIEVSKRSGKLMIEQRDARGELWFNEGALHDGALSEDGQSTLSGYEAIKRLLTWEFGQYEFDFKAEQRDNVIQRPLSSIKADGLKHVDQWSKMCEQLPSLNTIFRGDPAAIDDRPDPLNPAQRAIIELFDGELTAMQVISRSPESDLDALRELTQLYFEGLIYEVREAKPESVPDPTFIDSGFSDPAPSGVLPASLLGDTIVPAIPTPSEIDSEIDKEIESALDDLGAPPIMEEPPIADDFDIMTLAPPPPGVEEPPPMPAEEEASPEADNLTDEGRDILAELYAAPADPISSAHAASDFSPPPIPQDLPPDDDQADETFSTLFGVDGEFSYDDEEIQFFNEQLEEEVFGDPEPPQPMSGAARAFWLLLITSVAALTAFLMRDYAAPLKLDYPVAKASNWVQLELRDRELDPKQIAQSEGEWKIEISDEVTLVDEGDERGGVAQRAGRGRASSRSTSRRAKGNLKGLLKRALKAYRRGKYQEAADSAERALEIQPTSPRGLLIAATAYHEMKRDRDALKLLQTLLNTKPKYGDTKIDSSFKPGIVYLLTAISFDRIKNKAKAIEYYKRYLREFPNGISAREVQGIVSQLDR